jgi:hypothetical protein
MVDGVLQDWLPLFFGVVLAIDSKVGESGVVMGERLVAVSLRNLLKEGPGFSQ